MNTKSSSQAPLDLPADTRILACRVFQPELTMMGLSEPRVIYLDQGLHSRPKVLRDNVAQSIENIEQDAEVEQIILVYGYCGGGLEGIATQRASLVLPLMHDCIPLLKGAPLQEPEGRMQQSFYLSAGWVEYGSTPLTEYHKYAEKLGEENSMWVAKEMLKGYTSVTLLEHPAITKQEHRDYSAEMAGLFDLESRQAPCDLTWLERLLRTQLGDDVVVIPPGQPISLIMFLPLGQNAQAAVQTKE
jgi:hypothetical protein